MAVHHALSGESIDLRPLRQAMKSTLRSTLYKTQQLEVFCMILLAGKRLPEHHVVGEFTVQCLEGRIEFLIGTTRYIMRPGHLKCLAGRVPYSFHRPARHQRSGEPRVNATVSLLHRLACDRFRAH